MFKRLNRVFAGSEVANASRSIDRSNEGELINKIDVRLDRRRESTRETTRSSILLVKISRVNFGRPEHWWNRATKSRVSRCRIELPFYSNAALFVCDVVSTSGLHRFFRLARIN